ncbi:MULTISPECIES: DMT family transporter [unclassified Pseudomonas]|uniref:DMT family transporter n=1 Tax=unclassified Pseudomonas TaxID=196821 RepID=UPI000BC68B31|nr:MULTISPECIES: DMT family transporter [unclassified Pseudomonas]PVZ20791.1 EamA domain-containing membrane protein RarD [Pseudomonas sp. URIL14HWK12:I12]PVZ27857.1 EamA domain-containing membrane protein RarD [Pseudomonas sp. URIL14HWK12:I10]PVZ38746.1 EamA domain-containing membrane protein RarD [Pseudomonas sp. URIL14HWK12:I11]SNZ02185.1 EamA domain-containing membrane protein RarD [Pseudomonas sp. URIL14HWK12:I9]
MQPRQALIALHAGALLFGLAGIFGKLAQATPWVIVCTRAGFAVLALATFMGLVRAEPWRRPRRGEAAQLGLAGLLLAAHWVAFFQAIKVGGVAIGTLGFCSFPAFTVVLEALLFREQLRRAELLQILAVTLGLALVTPGTGSATGAMAGLLWGVLSGLLFALLALLNRARSPGIGPVQAALCQNAVVALALLPPALPEAGSLRALDWLWLGLLGVLCTGLAHGLFVASLRVIKARTAAVVFALEPVYGIAFAWWVFAEQPTGLMLAGGVLIIAATLLPALER